MSRTPLKFAGRSAVAGIALAAMGLLAASPASAAVPVLHTYVDEAPARYATMSATTGAVTPLSTPPSSDPDEIVGEEVFGGAGTSIGVFYDDPDEYFVYTWTPATGASSAGVAAFVAGADAGSLTVSGLDTLADGTTITTVQYDVTEGGGEFPTTTTYLAIATVNKTTGELTPVINVTPLYDSGYNLISLATDPISGTTFAFLAHVEDSESYFTALDFGTSSFDTPTQFEGTGFGNGFFQGVDFDATGTLYFIYGNNSREMYELSSIGAPATWPTAARIYIADAASNYEGRTPLSTLALTTAPPLALASTGAEFPAALLAVGGVAVVAGVVTVVTVTRKRRAA